MVRLMRNYTLLAESQPFIRHSSIVSTLFRVTLICREIKLFRGHFRLLFTSCEESVHFGAIYSVSRS